MNPCFPETTTVRYSETSSISSGFGQETVLSARLRALASAGELAAREARDVDLRYERVDERYVWVTDHGTRVGLLDLDEFTLEWIAPHPGHPSARPAEIPALYHAPTYQGGRIIMQWWVMYHLGPRRAHDAPAPEPFGVWAGHAPRKKPRTTVELVDGRGPQLTLRLSHVHPQDERIRGEHRVALGYDPLADSYTADIEGDLEAPDPYPVEFCNFYAGGVYDNRPRTKRYQATVWAHPDGRLVRWPHNPVSYLTPGMNDAEGERRIVEGGFVGYFADPHSNPVLEIIESNRPVTASTCCNIYDEHLDCLAPTGKEGGPYRWHVRFRMYSVSMEAALDLTRRASLVRYGTVPDQPDPMLIRPEVTDDDIMGHFQVRNPVFPAFYYGQVNDFEDALPIDRTVAGTFIWATQCPDNAIYWDPARGHSGSRSIRIRGREGQTVTARSQGPTPHLDPDTGYRISGWIRCESVAGFARIRFSEVGMHQGDPATADHVAGPLTGTCGWTYVECLFRTPPDGQFGWLYLEVDSAGSAWFDDVALEERCYTQRRK